jgi:predicted O-linked N-acetylglucosamine transferase (SPINDLY family)
VEGRKRLRQGQRALMAASPLCDAKGLASALQEAFEGMYDRWMAGADPHRPAAGSRQ